MQGGFKTLFTLFLNMSQNRPMNQPSTLGLRNLPWIFALGSAESSLKHTFAGVFMGMSLSVSLKSLIFSDFHYSNRIWNLEFDTWDLGFQIWDLGSGTQTPFDQLTLLINWMWPSSLRFLSNFSSDDKTAGTGQSNRHRHRKISHPSHQDTAFWIQEALCAQQLQLHIFHHITQIKENTPNLT